ncbi:DUF2303 family protein [Comamonas aquatica]|uniref:DUF2303 family protein n=1 Tax=Comamonas aquatica TaxID=225991 RepID=UPI002447B7F2|nr:DUF2303 family protein [Comamonas aquatica]MDH1815393.1 YfdQ family protein [Comamonas aquatica]
MNQATQAQATNTEAVQGEALPFSLGSPVLDQRDTTIDQANAAIFYAIGNSRGISPLVALPDDFSRHDVENYLPARIRARGTFTAPYMNDFVAYAAQHKEDGASVFVDADNITATAVLNLGTPTTPGHADQLAKLAPKRTAAYDALRNITRSPQTQRDMAEFLEDWLPYWSALHEGNPLMQGQAVLAIRNLTVEAAIKADHKEESLSASRSTFESVKASSEHTLPSLIIFKCKPYPDLQEREFALRLSVLTNDKTPRFQLRITALEEHIEQMATEFAVLIREAAEDQIPVLIGAYQKAN